MKLKLETPNPSTCHKKASSGGKVRIKFTRRKISSQKEKAIASFQGGGCQIHRHFAWAAQLHASLLNSHFSLAKYSMVAELEPTVIFSTG